MATRTRAQMRAAVYDDALYHEDVKLNGTQADAVVDAILGTIEGDKLLSERHYPTSQSVYAALLSLGIIVEADAR